MYELLLLLLLLLLYCALRIEKAHQPEPKLVLAMKPPSTANGIACKGPSRTATRPMRTASMTTVLLPYAERTQP